YLAGRDAEEFGPHRSSRCGKVRSYGLDIPYYREFELPWSTGAGQDARFRRLLAMICAAALFLGVVWPWIPTPAVDPYEMEELPPRIRSEEHTSELQSRENLVCRLLLEKKK